MPSTVTILVEKMIKCILIFVPQYPRYKQQYDGSLISVTLYTPAGV